MTQTFEIHYANGRTDGGYETYQAAIDAIESEYPDAEIGHDGDLTSGGERTMAWADEESRYDDDGARAIASIWPTV